MAFKFMERLTTETGESKRLVLQPNNGTRYEIVYCPGPETFLFGWYNVPGGKIAEFSTKAGLLVADYFMKKLGITSPADAAALLTLVNELTGRPVELPFGFDTNGIYLND